MKQLGILDAAFINLETANTPQHVGGLGIYDPSTAPGGFVRFKEVIANFEHRLNRMPLFRTRLIEVPGGIDRPYWVKDANFDVEFHLRHIALPEPGDWRQLCIQAARLHARPLDMSRPLWEAYIIEGLDNIEGLPKGSFAVYTKMHHALVDGAGGASFMSALHDLVPNPDLDANSASQEPQLIDRDPSVTELLARAAVNRTKNSMAIARGTLKLTRDLGKMAAGLYREEIPQPDINAPKTRFNQSVGPHRVFEATRYQLDDFKRIKNATGTKLNDVALAVISGALRRYLDVKGETPDGSLAGGIPLNMRTRRGVTEDNNQVGSIFSSLHTDIADPIERLRAIHASAVEAKEFGEQSPLVDSLKLAGIFSPALTKAVASFYQSRELNKLMPANVSTVISNVAGPNFSLYCAGAKMVQYHGLGLLTPGCGVFHLIFSYEESLTMSVLADRDIIPDPSLYRELLDDSFAELLERAIALETPVAGASSKKATTPAEKTKSKRKAATAKKKPAGKTKTATANSGLRKKSDNPAASKKAVKKTEKKTSKKSGTAARAQNKAVVATPRKKAARKSTETKPKLVSSAKKSVPAKVRPKLVARKRASTSVKAKPKSATRS